MPIPARRINRGPAAAPENRRAVLAAARRVFTEQGYRAPLNAIAREAGVGQGVLYRHFPTRLDLAFAVFEENFAELDDLADPSDPEAFGRLWARLLELVVRESAFVEMVVDARRTLPDRDLGARLRDLLAATLPAARAAGRVPGDLTPADVELTIRMVHGVVVTGVDDAEVRREVDRALALVQAWGRP